MTQKITPLIGAVRYSQKPIKAYSKMLAGVEYGPATSALLNTDVMWNLAFLSHDFEKNINHPDPMFSTHVRRSTQMRLDGSGLGLAEDPQTLVGSWLTLPAPRFVYLISENEKLLTTLPLYVAYGKAWLKTITARERLCDCGNKSNEDENSEATQSQVLASSDEANIFLAKLCAR